VQYHQIKSPPCAKGAPAKRVRDCYTIILDNLQIDSIYKQSPRHSKAVTPPRNCAAGPHMGGFGGEGGSLCWGEPTKIGCYRDSSLWSHTVDTHKGALQTLYKLTTNILFHRVFQSFCGKPVGKHVPLTNCTL